MSNDSRVMCGKFMTQELFSRRGLSFDRLSAFVAIAQARGITAASGGSPSRQSQLSRQLKELEGVFGVELIRRGRGQFGLTQAGSELLAISQLSFRAFDAFAQSCADEPVTLRIAAGESLLQGVVVPTLPELERDVPRANWLLLNRRSSDVLEELQSGECDIGIVRQGSIPKSLKGEDAGEVKQVLVVPPTLVGSELSAPMPGVDQMPIALAETAELSEAALAQAFGCRKLQIRLYCSSLNQAAEAVTQGIAAAVLPQFLAIRGEFSSCRIIRNRGLGRLSRKILIAWNPRLAELRPIVEKSAVALAILVRRRLSVRT